MNKVYRIVAGLLIGWMGVPGAAFAADASHGRELYMANCAGCLGEEGLSTMQEAPNLARFDMRNQSDESLIEIIESGSGPMPPYIGILDDSEILDIVSYLRTLN
jgi:cytochrome c6